MLRKALQILIHERVAVPPTVQRKLRAASSPDRTAPSSVAG